MSENNKTNKTIIVFSNDLDRVLAAFNIAVGAAALGFGVSMYFTFWGLYVLKKENAIVKGKTLIGKIFDFIMPNGPGNLHLSKMKMLGIGTWIIKKIMKNKQIAMLPELIMMAQELDVRLIACQMSMDI